jgi:hypothetical protein
MNKNPNAMLRAELQERRELRSDLFFVFKNDKYICINEEFAAAHAR